VLELENFSFFSRKFSRRNFLQTGALISGGMSLFPLMSQGAQLGFKPAVEPTCWYQKPLLILQTVLRETDAQHYDAQALVRYAENRLQYAGNKWRRYCRFF